MTYKRIVSKKFIILRLSVCLFLIISFVNEISELSDHLTLNHCHPIGIASFLLLPQITKTSFLFYATGTIISLILGGIGIASGLTIFLGVSGIVLIHSTVLGCVAGDSGYLLLAPTTTFILGYVIATVDLLITRGWVGILFDKAYILAADIKIIEDKIISYCKAPLILSYFCSGISKLLAKNNFWGNGYTFQHILLDRFLYADTILAFKIAGFFPLVLVASNVALIYELLTPISLFKKRFELTIVTHLLVFQFFCQLIMGIKHLQCYFYISFFPFAFTFYDRFSGTFNGVWLCANSSVAFGGNFLKKIVTGKTSLKIE